MAACDAETAKRIALERLGPAFPTGIVPGLDPAVSVHDAGDRCDVGLRMPDETLGGDMIVIVDKATT